MGGGGLEGEGGVWVRDMKRRYTCWEGRQEKLSTSQQCLCGHTNVGLLKQSIAISRICM
jgi:hypothetical protein